MPKESKTSATIRRRRCINPGLRQFVQRHKSPSADDNLDEDDDDQEFIHQEVEFSSPTLRSLMSSQWTLFLGLLAFRVINTLIIQTSYVPDEYWQSIEVAHKMAFGYGHLTWEWRTGLRSYTYPLIIAAIYKALALVHLDYRILIIKLPRLMHAVFAATGDLYLYKLSYKLAGPQVAAWSLLCQLTSWFTFFCLTRTLTNSVETILTTIALYYFPWPGRPRKAHWKFMSLVGLCVVIRPTAAVAWLPLCIWYMLLWRHMAWKVLKMVAEIGFLMLTLSSIIDRVFYGRWVYVHYNFLQFNVLSNMGTFYGSHPWHWYITQGFAVIMGSHIIPFILALRKGIEPAFLSVIGWTVFVYSCLGHKEFRFLFPIMPLAMHVCGVYLQYLTTDAWPDVQHRVAQAKKLREEERSQPEAVVDPACSDAIQPNNGPASHTPSQPTVIDSQPTDPTAPASITQAKPDVSENEQEVKKSKSELSKAKSKSKPKKSNAETYYSLFIKHCIQAKKGLDSIYMTLEYHSKKFWQKKNVVIGALIVTNLPLTLYTSVLHQRGTLDVMKYISDQSIKTVDGQQSSVMYLMPCHSTPYYGFVHNNISMRFLTCEPNLTNITAYADEADIFYADPKQWLKEELAKMSEKRQSFARNELPSQLVMFNVLLPEIEDFLTDNHYQECMRFFHTHFPEGRVGSHVVVMCLKKWVQSTSFHGNKKLHEAFRL